MNREQPDALGIGRKEYLLYSVIIQFGSKVMTDEELEKLVECYLNIVKKGDQND